MVRITRINEDAAREGVWINYRGVDLCIARANNEKFKNTFLRLTKGYKNSANMTEDVAEDVLCKSLTCNVLTNWRNFSIDGKELEFNKENCLELLVEDPDCRMFILEFAQDIENYLEEEQAKTAEK